MRSLYETKVKNKWGQIVISPGLKVRHKKSQFEYTVNKVVVGKNGKVTILLSSPTKPRFKPDKTKQKKVIADVGATMEFDVDPDEDMSMYYEVPSQEKGDKKDLLAVNQEEFEKDYEVK